MAGKVETAQSSNIFQLSDASNNAEQIKPLSNTAQQDETAIAFLAKNGAATANHRLKTGDAADSSDDRKTAGDFLRDILREQPLIIDKTGAREIKLTLVIKKPTAQMTIADYDSANWKAIFGAAGYGNLSDEEIALAVQTMRENGSVMPTKADLKSLRKADANGILAVTTDRISIEYAKRAAQAVLQYQNYQAKNADLNGLKSKTEVNNISQDMAIGMPYETTRKIVDSTINLPQDSLNSVLSPPVGTRTGSEPNFGRAKIGEMYDELANRKLAEGYTGQLPRINTDAIKYNWQSEMMRRDLNGKLDGDGIKRGDATSTATSILAPLVIGKVLMSAESPQSLKSLGGLPEVESVNSVLATNKANVGIRKFSEYTFTEIQ